MTCSYFHYITQFTDVMWRVTCMEITSSSAEICENLDFDSLTMHKGLIILMGSLALGVTYNEKTCWLIQIATFWLSWYISAMIISCMKMKVPVFMTEEVKRWPWTFCHVLESIPNSLFYLYNLVDRPLQTEIFYYNINAMV